MLANHKITWNTQNRIIESNAGMSLLDFVSKPEHLVAREKLLHLKVSFDLKLAAARSGVQLQLTEPEIDNIGHDFFMSQGFLGTFVQNKAVLSSARTMQWNLHPRFLQADFQNRDICPQVDNLPVGGMHGGYGVFLLHEISASAAKEGRLEIAYYYFDINVANAVRNGIWQVNGFSKKDAEDLLRQIAFPQTNNKVIIKKKYMLPIRSVEAILAFRMHLPNASNYMSIGGKSKETMEKIGHLWVREIRYWLSR